MTLRQLARMTAGYADYVAEPRMDDAKYAEPFRRGPRRTPRLSNDKPLVYQPGTNWNYPHTDYVILGLAIEKATGRIDGELLPERCSSRSGWTNTGEPRTAEIPDRRCTPSPPNAASS